MGLTTRPSNVRVCQFRHGRECMPFASARTIILIHAPTVKQFLKVFFQKKKASRQNTDEVTSDITKLIIMQMSAIFSENLPIPRYIGNKLA